MFARFYTLTKITCVVIKLNVFCYIMLKIFITNNFIHLFYFKMISLRVVIIDFQNF